MTAPWLSLVIFTPWAGALAVALLPRGAERTQRRATLLFSLSTLLWAAPLLAHFHPAAPGLQEVENVAWIPSLHIRYHVGLDGLSLVLVLLAGVVAPAALLASSGPLPHRRLFGSLFLLLQGTALGAFLTVDFFAWFLFWELSLVPAYFLLRLWGGAGAARAAYQFILYTLGGSVLLLLGFIALYAAAGTLDFAALADLGRSGELALRLAACGRIWPAAVFGGILIGLAVKVPLFPFHTWLPPAYAEAPPGLAMFLTGVMSKMGLYGILRILWPIFPSALRAAAPVLIGLAVAGAVLPALAAAHQSRIRRMLAYASVSHVSTCLIAVFAVAAGSPARAAGAAGDALGGALFQMVSHGLSAAALFACAGILESRAEGRGDLADFGGVQLAAPRLAGLCAVAVFASIGLPGLNGFIGEFLIFRGLFTLNALAACVAVAGLFFTALYLLGFWQKVFHGPAAGAGAGFRDLAFIEAAPLAGLAALIVVCGVAPQVLTWMFNPLVARWAGMP